MAGRPCAKTGTQAAVTQTQRSLLPRSAASRTGGARDTAHAAAQAAADSRQCTSASTGMQGPVHDPASTARSHSRRQRPQFSYLHLDEHTWPGIVLTNMSPSPSTQANYWRQSSNTPGQSCRERHSSHSPSARQPPPSCHPRPWQCTARRRKPSGSRIPDARREQRHKQQQPVSTTLDYLLVRIGVGQELQEEVPGEHSPKVPTAAQQQWATVSNGTVQCPWGACSKTVQVIARWPVESTHIPSPAIVDGHLYNRDIRGVLKNLHTCRQPSCDACTGEHPSALRLVRMVAFEHMQDIDQKHMVLVHRPRCGHLACVLCGRPGVGDHEKRLKLGDGLCHIGISLTRWRPPLAPKILRVVALRPACACGRGFFLLRYTPQLVPNSFEVGPWTVTASGQRKVSSKPTHPSSSPHAAQIPLPTQ